MSYLLLADALARAKERSQAPNTADAYLTELLNMSAGTSPINVTHYRPFICAARWLEQNRGDQTIAAADGATFTNQATPIRSLYDLQRAYDTANALAIPEGWEVPVELTSLGRAGIRRGTRSHVTESRP